jgi:hypothetical protein
MIQLLFYQFIKELEGIPTILTLETLSGLSLLCDEFQFAHLKERIEKFRNSIAFQFDVILVHFDQEIK